MGLKKNGEDEQLKYKRITRKDRKNIPGIPKNAKYMGTRGEGDKARNYFKNGKKSDEYTMVGKVKFSRGWKDAKKSGRTSYDDIDKTIGLWNTAKNRKGSEIGKMMRKIEKSGIKGKKSGSTHYLNVNVGYVFEKNPLTGQRTSSKNGYPVTDYANNRNSLEIWGGKGSNATISFDPNVTVRGFKTPGGGREVFDQETVFAHEVYHAYRGMRGVLSNKEEIREKNAVYNTNQHRFIKNRDNRNTPGYKPITQ